MKYNCIFVKAKSGFNAQGRWAWKNVPLRLQLRQLSNQLEKYDNWFLSLSMITWTSAINARSTTQWIGHSSHTLSLRTNVLLEFYHTSALQRQLSVRNFTIWWNSAQTAVPYPFIILHGMRDVGRYTYCDPIATGQLEKRRARKSDAELPRIENLGRIISWGRPQ